MRRKNPMPRQRNILTWVLVAALLFLAALVVKDILGVLIRPAVPAHLPAPLPAPDRPPQPVEPRPMEPAQGPPAEPTGPSPESPAVSDAASSYRQIPPGQVLTQ